jgi:hypothetical protein
MKTPVNILRSVDKNTQEQKIIAINANKIMEMTLIKATGANTNDSEALFKKGNGKRSRGTQEI